MADSLQVAEGDVVYIKMDIYQNLIALIDEFNTDISAPTNGTIKPISRDLIKQGKDSIIEYPCKVAHIGNQSYGKLPKEAISDQIIMEYKYFYKFLAQGQYLPNKMKYMAYFRNFLKDRGDKKIYELSDFMMMTLQSPRIKYYQSANYYDIQKAVTGYSNNLIEALGFFPIRMQMDVLEQM